MCSVQLTVGHDEHSVTTTIGRRNGRLSESSHGCQNLSMVETMLPRIRMIAILGSRTVGPALALTLFTAGTCRAQEELAGSLRVTAENDYFDFWIPPAKRPDDNYTQGFRIEWAGNRVPTIARRFVCRSKLTCGSTLAVGQEMFTPTDDAALPIEGERPYAGWLYVRAGAVVATDRMRRALGATLGVTGRASFAEQTQEAFHRLIPGFRRPLGWGNQLPTEPAAALLAEETWYLSALPQADGWLDVMPWTNATLGTLRTAIGVGTRARIGAALRHPWLVNTRAKPWEAYLFLSGQAEAVGHDLFLDGSTFGRSVRVDRTPFVSNWDLGVSVRFRRLGLEYRAVTEGKAYRTGPSLHRFGGITVTWWNAQ